MELLAKIYKTDPTTSESAEEENGLIISPSYFNLKPMFDESERPSCTIMLKTNTFIKLDENGLVESSFLESFELNTLKKAFVTIFSDKGIREVIPVEFVYSIKPIQLLFQEKDDVVERIEFGEVVPFFKLVEWFWWHQGIYPL